MEGDPAVTTREVGKFAVTTTKVKRSDLSTGKVMGECVFKFLPLAWHCCSYHVELYNRLLKGWKNLSGHMDIIGTSLAWFPSLLARTAAGRRHIHTIHG